MHYVALLRGINLGKRRIKMERLRELFEALPFSQVRTFIASGNVLFHSPQRDTAKLERRIEQHLERELGYSVDTFVRSLDEMEKVATEKVFPEEELTAGHTLNVVFCKEALEPAVASALSQIRTDVDAFRVKGREFYWLCRIRMSDSVVWSRPEAKSLRLPTSTMRNHRTVTQLAELLRKGSTT